MTAIPGSLEDKAARLRAERRQHALETSTAEHEALRTQLLARAGLLDGSSAGLVAFTLGVPREDLARVGIL